MSTVLATCLILGILLALVYAAWRDRKQEELGRVTAGWRREELRGRLTVQVEGHEVVYDERLSGGRR